MVSQVVLSSSAHRPHRAVRKAEREAAVHRTETPADWTRSLSHSSINPAKVRPTLDLGSDNCDLLLLRCWSASASTTHHSTSHSTTRHHHHHYNCITASAPPTNLPTTTTTTTTYITDADADADDTPMLLC